MIWWAILSLFILYLLQMNFENRHIGVQLNDQAEMLQKIGVSSLDELIDQTVPSNIRLKNALNIPDATSEKEWLLWCEKNGDKNELFTNFIGQGYYGTITPSVILRNIFENPGWYTAYTPYQAEISQGRMEALLNFQTMICDLTGMELANASLLDEATAAAEAMIMLWGNRNKKEIESGKNIFVLDEAVFHQTKLVVKTRAKYLGIEVVETNVLQYSFNDKTFGALVQYPNSNGQVIDYSNVSAQLKSVGAFMVVASDLLSLCLLKEPATFGADVVVGNSQRFGVPMAYGGPHAAFFATKDEFKRGVPGRIIGVSKDTKERYALRMALQTREQHIKREKATSNICTAQALLSIMASMYAVFHGAEGLKSIAQNVHDKANLVAKQLLNVGVEISNEAFFDTLYLPNVDAQKIKSIALKHKVNFHYPAKGGVCLSVDESTRDEDIEKLINIFTEVKQSAIQKAVPNIQNFVRSSSFLQHPVFNQYHSESLMMRYIKRLENKDISLVHGMISLGSCTMKLNAASEMIPLSWAKYNALHPFVPQNQALGYQQIINELAQYLMEVTGFAGISFQPNSGAQGELAGLLTIKKYFEVKGESYRDIVLIPASAHGTNPASAVMAGLKVVVTKCDENGNIDVADLRAKAEQYKDNLAALMVTYPSTHGVFETAIKEITQLIHDFGGQVYMDGANMNAQVGLTSPAEIGADVCHLNLHKTFAIPHGGGGPGMGPIGVAKHLVPHLPQTNFEEENPNSLGVISAAPYASTLILIISLGYIKMLGGKGITKATKFAILNANYLMECLKNHYSILYTGENGRVAHEMIIDCRPIKQETGIDIMDIAKRLIDYGFHSPTVSFPVAGTLMIEPTESEDKAELDKFVSAMINIAQEIEEVKNGIYPANDNVLVNAPHPAEDLLKDKWEHAYSREKAAYPLSYLINNKYWVPISRVDNAYGDRNLICTCPEIASFAENA